MTCNQQSSFLTPRGQLLLALSIALFVLLAGQASQQALPQPATIGEIRIVFHDIGVSVKGDVIQPGTREFAPCRHMTLLT